ncbi:MAG: hypothetical protein Q9216_000032 [Gyalolechia sp. 2 TL-2023]
MSTNDIWTCHCSECTVGRPTFSNGHHALPKDMDLGIEKMIGVDDEEEEDMDLDASVYGDDAFMRIVKNGVE